MVQALNERTGECTLMDGFAQFQLKN